MFYHSRILLALLSLIGLFFGSCANIKNISGGPDDKTPPKILTEKSTQNFSKNFNSRKIILTFNEWVTLNNPVQNIIISPPTEYPLKYKLQKKSLVIEFNEKENLKDSTTYTINIGESIKDLTAQNPASNIKFIFSTGDVIDSLQIKGSVRDAKTLKGQEKALVLLYSNLNDSVISKIKPDYFSWTDKDGNFEVDNLRQGTYRIFTILDKNQNYIYDQPSESIGFQNEYIQLSDTLNQDFLLWISQEKLPLTIKDFKIVPGKGTFVFNRASSDLKINLTNAINKFIWNAKDSLVFWYESYTSSLGILQYENKTDTVNLPPFNKNQIKSKKETLTAISRFIKPGQPLKISGTDAINSVDSTKVKILNGTFLKMVLNQDDPRIIELYSNFHDLAEDIVVLDSFFTKSINGLYNSHDSIRLNIINEKSLSKLKVTIEGLTPGIQYIFQVLDKDKVITENIFLANSEKQITNLTSIDPGKYSARLILDQNKNKEWDPVNFIKKNQPEKIWVWPLEELRPDWEIEVTLNLNK